MDEPNAAVDALYEINKYRKFMEVLKNSAAVIVSHRLPICQLADKVVVMAEGRILECGSHEDLMKAPGSHYGRMFKSKSELYMGHGVLGG